MTEGKFGISETCQLLRSLRSGRKIYFLWGRTRGRSHNRL